MIRSPLPLMIQCWCLYLATLKPDPILAGRSRPPHGQPCSSGSNKGSRSVTSPMITVCHMRRSGECCVPLSPLSRKSRYHPSCQDSTTHLQGRQNTQRVGPACAASGTPDVYHQRAQHTREVPGSGTEARREAGAPHGVLHCTIDVIRTRVVFCSGFRNGCRKLSDRHSGTPPH